ncbi:MAG: hypothetical protein V4772_14700 [Pseudomonadota bacterium]
MRQSFHYLIKLLCHALPGAMALLCLASAAQAATSRVDDSGTVVSQSVLPMRWKQLVPGRGADHSVEGSVRVAVRLNMARWVNQNVRLYMALAPADGEPVYVSWRTAGHLLPGTVRSGGRSLIFSGVVNAAVLEEPIELSIKTDGRALATTQGLQFYFEIDSP